MEYTSDGSTYAVAPYRHTLHHRVVSLFSYQSSASGFTRPSSAAFWVDPFDPRQAVNMASNKPTNYDIGADSESLYGVDELTYAHCVKKSYKTKEVIGVTVLYKNRFVSFGKDGLGFLMVRDNPLLFTTTDNNRKFDISFDGSTIYYSTHANEVRSVGVDGTGDRLVFSTVGDTGEIAVDPWNANTLVYIDRSDIRHHNLSTSVSTDVLTDGDMSGNKGTIVLNSVVYTNY